MCSVTCQKYATFAVGFCHRYAEIPKANIIKLKLKFLAYSAMQHGNKIVIFFGCSKRYRRVKKPIGPVVNAAKKLPIALKVWVKYIVKRLAWIDFQ